VQCSTLICHSL